MMPIPGSAKRSVWKGRCGYLKMRARLACSPCIHVGHRLGTPQGCPARTCLDLVEPLQVVAAAERVLAAAPSAVPVLGGARA